MVKQYTGRPPKKRGRPTKSNEERAKQLTITLSAFNWQACVERAALLGKTINLYIADLIDQDIEAHPTNEMIVKNLVNMIDFRKNELLKITHVMADVDIVVLNKFVRSDNGEMIEISADIKFNQIMDKYNIPEDVFKTILIDIYQYFFNKYGDNLENLTITDKDAELAATTMIFNDINRRYNEIDELPLDQQLEAIDKVFTDIESQDWIEYLLNEQDPLICQLKN